MQRTGIQTLALLHCRHTFIQLDLTSHWVCRSSLTFDSELAKTLACLELYQLAWRLCSRLRKLMIARGARQSSAFDVFRHGLPCLPESICFDYSKDHYGDTPTTGNLDSISDCMRLPSGLDAYLWISGLRNPEALRVTGVTYLAIQICDGFNINDSDSETEQSTHGQRLCCLVRCQS